MSGRRKNSPYGRLLSHNGLVLNGQWLSPASHPSFRNLPDTQKLKEYLDFEAHSHINTDSDSEIMLQVFSSELFQKNKIRVDVQDLSIGLERMYCTSALLVFALCGNVAGIAIIGARDSHSSRPLVVRSRPHKD